MAYDDNEEDRGTLVFQGGKKLSDEYYIVSVYDSQEKGTLTFSGYELENSETYNISFPYVEFDALFKADPDMFNNQNKESRYQWIVQRLDFVTEGSGKKLVLASEPTLQESDTPATGGKVIPTGRPNYIDRQKHKQELDRLEEKRARNISEKALRARKHFLAELQEKTRLEELKAAARTQRIEEERQERREKDQMARRRQEEKLERYTANNEKRETRIIQLELERKSREERKIAEIVEEDRRKRVERDAKLDAAKRARRDQELAAAQQLEADRERMQALEAKREVSIEHRQERAKHREEEYLEARRRTLETIERQKQDKAARKLRYVSEKAAERARILKQKHDEMVEWAKQSDGQAQAEHYADQARAVMLSEHIDSLKAARDKKEHELLARKQAAVAESNATNQRQVDEAAARNKEMMELQAKREQNIAAREELREKRYHEYIEHVRQLKGGDKAQAGDAGAEELRAQAREERLQRRKQREQEAERRAELNRLRDAKIRAKQGERDAAEATRIAAMKQAARDKEAELDAAREAVRLEAKAQLAQADAS